MSITSARRVDNHRKALRAAGLRPVQYWVPDTRSESFADDCRAQARLARDSDARDTDLLADMEAALSAVEGWSN